MYVAITYIDCTDKSVVYFPVLCVHRGIFTRDVWHHCYSLERSGHRGVVFAVTDCTGCSQHESMKTL